MTELVSKKETNDYDIDITRSDWGESHMNNTPAKEPGWLGNPYKVDEYGLSEAVHLFRRDFNHKIDTNPKFREAVQDLRGQTIACSCKESPCHGDIILQYLGENESLMDY